MTDPTTTTSSLSERDTRLWSAMHVLQYITDNLDTLPCKQVSALIDHVRSLLPNPRNTFAWSLRNHEDEEIDKVFYSGCVSADDVVRSEQQVNPDVVGAVREGDDDATR